MQGSFRILTILFAIGLRSINGFAAFSQMSIPIELSINNQGSENLVFIQGHEFIGQPFHSFFDLKRIETKIEEVSDLVVRLHFQRPVVIELFDVKLSEKLPTRLLNHVDLRVDTETKEAFKTLSDYDPDSYITFDNFQQKTEDYFRQLGDKGEVFVAGQGPDSWPTVLKFKGLSLRLFVSAVLNSDAQAPYSLRGNFKYVVDAQGSVSSENLSRSHIEGLSILSQNDPYVKNTLASTARMRQLRKEYFDKLLISSVMSPSKGTVIVQPKPAFSKPFMRGQLTNDGRHLVYLSDDNRLNVMTVPKNENILNIKTDSEIKPISIDSNSSLVAVVFSDAKVRVYSLFPRNELIRTINILGDDVRAVKFISKSLIIEGGHNRAVYFGKELNFVTLQGPASSKEFCMTTLEAPLKTQTLKPGKIVPPESNIEPMIMPEPWP